MSANMLTVLVTSILLAATGITLKGVSLQQSSTGNVHLVATMINQLTQEKYLMEEYAMGDINDPDGLSGKIELTKEGAEKVTVFYREGSDYRLVMYSNQCSANHYESATFERMLPNVDQPVENFVLMSGPSLYFSVLTQKKGSEWIKGEQVSTRGVTANTASRNVLHTLNVTVYSDESLERPLRVDLNGYLPTIESSFSGASEYITINFYMIEHSSHDFSDIISPLPGIGCLRYLEDDKPMPRIDFDRFHFYADEVLGDEDSRTGVEVFIDRVNKLSRYSTRMSGYFLAAVYDYYLGTTYMLKSDKTCAKQPITNSDNGIVNGEFDVNDLLWLNGNFKYLGKMFYDQRSGIICDVWEALHFDQSIDGETFDKVVTTQYFTQNVDSSGDLTEDSPLRLVASTRIGYKKSDGKGSYTREKVQRRDIYEFGPTIDEAEFQNLFQISDCYPDSSQRLSLIFDIEPEDASEFNQSMKLAAENTYALREAVEDFILHFVKVSKLRIASIDFDFSPERILSKVLFLEKPSVEASFSARTIKVKRESLGGSHVKTIDECVKLASLKSSGEEKAKFFLVPADVDICIVVNDESKLVEDKVKGTEYKLYQHDVGDIARFAEEIPLNQLHEILLQSLKVVNVISLPKVSDKSLYTTYVGFNVKNIFREEQPEDVKKSKQLFQQTAGLKKLNSGSSRVQRITGTVKTLDDCYQACRYSNYLECSAFSYCSGGSDAKVCLVTDERLDQATSSDSYKDDSHCSVFEKQYLLEYQKTEDRLILEIDITPKPAKSPEDCAKTCSSSKDCKAFVVCKDSPCGLALISEMNVKLKTDWTKRCSVYTPKNIGDYKITGNNLVKDVVHTEIDINLDQCAALCHQFSSGDDKCLSFNHCPRGTAKSYCQLAAVKLSTNKQESIPSVDCKNYELIDSGSSKYKGPGDGENVSKASSGAIFGIIMAFGLVGLMIGAAASFGWSRYTRVSGHSSLIPSSIPWSRQRDEEDQVQINRTL